MPWSVEKGHGCPASKPWAVVQTGGDHAGDVMGCHPTKAAAVKQQKALYQKEPMMSAASAGPAPPRDLYRALDHTLAPLELRDGGEGDGGGMPTLFGRFAVFGEWAEIHSFWEGDFLERLDPGCMDRCFKEERAGMRVLFQHGRDPVAGEKPLGTIQALDAKKDGAHYEVPLLDAGYVRDLVPGLKAGLYGASFRFTVLEENWKEKPGESKANPKGLPERTVLDVSVREFGPVTFPAYPSATAGVRSACRSLTDLFHPAGMPATDLTGAPGARSAGRGEPRDAGRDAHPSPAAVARHRSLRLGGIV